LNSKHERDENGTGSVMDTQKDKNAKAQTKEETAFGDLMHVLGFKKKKGEAKDSSSTSPPVGSTKAEEQSPPHSDDAPVLEEFLYASIQTESDVLPSGETEKCSDSGPAEEASTEENVDTVRLGADGGLAVQSEPAPKKRISRKVICVMVAAAVVGVGLYFAWPTLTEPVPPGEDVVATYSGKSITIEELNKVITLEQAKEMEHVYCQVHGYDHSKCDPTEECETHPIDTLEGYRQMTTNYAVEQIIHGHIHRKIPIRGGG